ncbi:MAG: hypothetical protein J6Y26_01005 [Lachnospiraceae bacterium]|nr:hypothetical protein [Lachnospiraceae bacterium]
MRKPFKVLFGPAKCAVDLCDGSERGEYVNQDYILTKLRRPHRAINLMYCYYPNDKGWPLRASVAHAHDAAFAWDYPYDDYFPYTGGLGGDTKGPVFEQMRDIRRHGQDVCLTLTMDPFLPDEHIASVARDLRPFGRITVRINHEATGSWFSFNKRATYEEVAAFFVRACGVFHREAPNAQIVLCLDGCKDLSERKMVMEDIFTEAAKAADIVSVDRYLALHWRWPGNVCEDARAAADYNTDDIYALAKKSYKRYIVMNEGVKKPMVMSELNADGDVTGPYYQAEKMKHFCDRLKADREHWLSGFTMYQFRDRGRLGLEIEDPNNADNGIEQPVLGVYRDIIQDPFFQPSRKRTAAAKCPVTLRFGGAEDFEGLSVPVAVEGRPVFFEAYFDGELADENLMLEVNGTWFYKKPGVRCIDMSSAWFGSEESNRDAETKGDKASAAESEVLVTIVAPPASGENDLSLKDGDINYYRTLTVLPRFRVRYAPILDARKQSIFNGKC